MNFNWINGLDVAITVCDTNGIILEMNEKSCKVFEKDGGKELLGKNLYDCHPGPAKNKLEELLKNGKANVYSIEKNGVKKLIYQAPFYEDNQCKGFVEFSMEIPFEMPHFIRK
jgi:transcriptional regulator with PAS, ATPase and Fis domain